MSDLLSPAQVARAINVSESSVKRWCDDGTFTVQRTAGGHRRIPTSEVLRYLQREKVVLADPSILGLPAATSRSSTTLERAAEQFLAAMLDGNTGLCREILFGLYLADHSLAAIGDKVIAPAFHSAGDGWECGNIDIYQERRGCEVTGSALHELRRVLPQPPATAPLAIGGTLEGDNYTLSTQLVEAVLLQSGWRTMQLGANLPGTSVAAAIRRHQPRLVWVSCSHVQDEASVISQMKEVFSEVRENRALVVGGRALTAEIRTQMNFTVFCDTLQHLQNFAASYAIADAT